MKTAYAYYANYVWRLLVTGLCFASFALGGALLSAIALPILGLLPGAARQRHLRARRLIGFMFGVMIRTLCVTRTMRLEISGLDRLRRHPGALILANHPTLIDVVILLWLYPQASCVVKAALWKNPFYWGVVRAAGYIDNASPESLIEDCAGRLTEGESLLIFPEGTRTLPGEPLDFTRGASYVALRCGRPLVPVVITCDPPTLTKNAPWYRIPPRAFEMRIAVQEPLPLESLIPVPDPMPIAARRLTAALQNYFTDELNAYANT